MRGRCLLNLSSAISLMIFKFSNLNCNRFLSWEKLIKTPIFVCCCVKFLKAHNSFPILAVSRVNFKKAFLTLQILEILRTIYISQFNLRPFISMWTLCIKIWSKHSAILGECSSQFQSTDQRIEGDLLQRTIMHSSKLKMI